LCKRFNGISNLLLGTHDGAPDAQLATKLGCRQADFDKFRRILALAVRKSRILHVATIFAKVLISPALGWAGGETRPTLKA